MTVSTSRSLTQFASAESTTSILIDSAVVSATQEHIGKQRQPSSLASASSLSLQEISSSASILEISADSAPVATAGTPSPSLSSSEVPSKSPFSRAVPTLSTSTAVAIAATAGEINLNFPQDLPTSSISDSLATSTGLSALISDTPSNTQASSAVLTSEKSFKQASELQPTRSVDASPPSSTAFKPAASSVHQDFPGPENGNLAMAIGYNHLFQTLAEDSSCDPKDNKSYIACVDGQPATCEIDGHYTLISCPQGQSCYAMPRLAGQVGVDIGCQYPSVAAQKLAAAAASSTLAATTAAVQASSQSSPEASSNPRVIQTSPKGGDPASVKIEAASSTSLDLGGAQEKFTAPETSIQPAASQDAAGTQEVSVQATPTAQRSRASIEQQRPSKPVGVLSSVEKVSPTIASPAASQTDGDPLVLSFPSDLPSSTAPTTTEAPANPSSVEEPTLSLVANQKDTRPPAVSLVNAGLLASPAPQAVDHVAANSVPSTTAEMQPSATIATDGAGITIVPMGVDDHDGFTKTVTVTVTTTVHDR